jgi:hypothetical protein
MTREHLLKPEGVWLHLLVGTQAETDVLVADLSRIGKGKAVCRVIRGEKSTTTADLFDELSAALQFPSYFGDNWDAVDECLTDLEWLPGEAYVIVIVDSIHLLEGAPPDQVRQFCSVLARAAKEWGQPVEGAWARPARAFHVVWQCAGADEKRLRERLHAAQVSFDVLE